jgi:acyl dehydratase
MPLTSDLVGSSAPPMTHDIDARWTMAYAAALGDIHPCYTDTRQPGGVVAHPLFPVCFEWPLIVAGRQLPGDDRLTLAERMRSVHATHDLHIHRPVRPGDRLTTCLTIVGVERRKPGAYQVMRLDTTDASGTPVCTTWMGALYRGVEVAGPDRPAAEAPSEPGPIPADVAARNEIRVPVAANLAHTYTECARIWNPIHTDRAFAMAAGLPDIILHGTATLALAVSRVIESEAAGDPTRVRRIAARFGAMVLMPSEIVVRLFDAKGGAVRFDVHNAEGGLAVRDGMVVLYE